MAPSPLIQRIEAPLRRFKMKERTPTWILSEPTCVMDQRSGTRAGPVIGSVRGVNASAVRTLRGRRKQNTEDVSFGSISDELFRVTNVLNPPASSSRYPRL